MKKAENIRMLCLSLSTLALTCRRCQVKRLSAGPGLAQCRKDYALHHALQLHKPKTCRQNLARRPHHAKTHFFLLRLGVRFTLCHIKRIVNEVLLSSSAENSMKRCGRVPQNVARMRWCICVGNPWAIKLTATVLTRRRD